MFDPTCPWRPIIGPPIPGWAEAEEIAIGDPADVGLDDGRPPVDPTGEDPPLAEVW